MNSERMGSPRERVYEAPTSRAHVFTWGAPRSARFAFGDAQGDIMAARVVRDPAGGVESLPDGAAHEGGGTCAAA